MSHYDKQRNDFEASLAQAPGNEDGHYAGKIQPIEYLESVLPDFLLGNVVKYLCRHRAKNGREDLLKAAWYLERYRDHVLTNYKAMGQNDFAQAQGLTPTEKDLLGWIPMLKTLGRATLIQGSPPDYGVAICNDLASMFRHLADKEYPDALVSGDGDGI